MKAEKHAYTVGVETTNAMKNTCAHRNPEGRDEYFACEHGFLTVVTDDPAKIYDMLGMDTVVSIEKNGPGYHLA